MSVRKAQNRVRKEHGIGKGALHKRMSSKQMDLNRFAYEMEWPGTPSAQWIALTKQTMHDLVETLAADSIISAAYTEAEEAARASG